MAIWARSDIVTADVRFCTDRPPAGSASSTLLMAVAATGVNCKALENRDRFLSSDIMLHLH